MAHPSPAVNFALRQLTELAQRDILQFLKMQITHYFISKGHSYYLTAAQKCLGLVIFNFRETGGFNTDAFTSWFYLLPS